MMPASMLSELHKIAAEAGNSSDFYALDLLHDHRMRKKKKRILPAYKESQLPKDPKQEEPEDTNLEDARDSTEQVALAEAKTKTAASIAQLRREREVLRALAIAGLKHRKSGWQRSFRGRAKK